MTDLIRRIPWPNRDLPAQTRLATREWLVTNGLGGYASGTVSTLITRRYHGLLIAALPAPLGRMNMLSHLYERLGLPGGSVAATTVGWEASGTGKPAELLDLVEFRLENGLPVWRYELGELVLEKRLLLPYRQNTVHVTYRLVSAPGPVSLQIRPAVHFRPHERPVSDPLAGPYGLTVLGDRYELFASPELPRLRLRASNQGAAFRVSSQTIQHVLYPVEQSRGYEATGDLWSPGYFRMTLEPEGAATIVASTDPWEAVDALDPATALRTEQARRRRLHADRPSPRSERPGARARARGRPVRGDAGGTRGRHRADPGHGGRGTNDHRGLPLVHRLGPRHHDQPRRIDPPDGPPRRGRLHPPDLRALRSRRPDPEHVPRRHARGAVPHGRRQSLVLPCARPVPPGNGRSRDAPPSPADAQLDRRPPREWHPVRHRRRSGGRTTCGKARPATS